MHIESMMRAKILRIAGTALPGGSVFVYVCPVLIQMVFGGNVSYIWVYHEEGFIML